MSLSEADAEVVAWYTTESLRIRSQADMQARSMWAQLQARNNFGDEAIDWIAGNVSQLGEASQMAMGYLTNVYLTENAARHGVSTAPGLNANVTAQALRNGVSGFDLYGRAGTTVYTALSKGHDIEKAGEMGLTRLLNMLATNIQLAKTHSSQNILERQKGVTWYRRVPEGSYTCALCLVASTQRYHRGDLLPIHPGCDCSITQQFGDKDPGWLVDPDRLDAVHKAMEERFGNYEGSARSLETLEDGVIKYRDAIIQYNHGEIGPVIALKKHKHYVGLDRGI